MGGLLGVLVLCLCPMVFLLCDSLGNGLRAAGRFPPPIPGGTRVDPHRAPGVLLDEADCPNNIPERLCVPTIGGRCSLPRPARVA